MIGVGISLAVLLMKSLEPGLNAELRTDPTTRVQYVYAKPSSGLSFPSVDFFRASILKLMCSYRDVDVVVLSFGNWTTFDYTVINALSALVKSFQSDNRILIFTECDQALVDALEVAGVTNLPHASPTELSDILRKNCFNDKEPMVAIDAQRLRSNSGDYGSVKSDTPTHVGGLKPLL